MDLGTVIRNQSCHRNNKDLRIHSDAQPITLSKIDCLLRMGQLTDIDISGNINVLIRWQGLISLHVSIIVVVVVTSMVA